MEEVPGLVFEGCNIKFEYWREGPFGLRDRDECPI